MKTDNEPSGCRDVKKKQGESSREWEDSKEDDYSFVLPKGFYAPKSGNWLDTEVFMG